VTALTIRLPDDKYRRLKEIANQRGTSINRLIDEMTTLLLADMDTETRFLIRAERGRGKVERGLELLKKGLRMINFHYYCLIRRYPVFKL
jgi:predicted transcriptional regulator